MTTPLNNKIQSEVEKEIKQTINTIDIIKSILTDQIKSDIIAIYTKRYLILNATDGEKSKIFAKTTETTETTETKTTKTFNPSNTNSPFPRNELIYNILAWDKPSPYKLAIDEILKKNTNVIEKFNKLINNNKDLLNLTSDNTDKLLNNDLKNINAKDELIYSIKSKYNSIISILLLIFIIVSYLYYFKKL
jgi:hypothetical protein